jgi:hypothetical protein
MLIVFVVYLTTLFQYLRLYSVDFYSILIYLPSRSEAGETRVLMLIYCRYGCKVNRTIDILHRARNYISWHFAKYSRYKNMFLVPFEKID